MTKTILVGCGNMGFAMLQGWLDSGRLAAADVSVVEPNEELRTRAGGLGVQTADHAAALAPDVQPYLVVLAVKPQVIRAVAQDYRRFGGGGTLFLSVAAGTSTATLEEVLGPGTPIVRCMPNTPASIGKGMMVVFATPKVDASALASVKRLLEASGAVAEIAQETLMDAVTAVSGSGPAYLFHFVECLTEAAEAVGLAPEIAAQLARQTVFGAATLVMESGEQPSVLRRQVTSPNGTTAAALDVLMSGDRLKSLVAEAVRAAQRRSVELG